MPQDKTADFLSRYGVGEPAAEEQKTEAPPLMSVLPGMVSRHAVQGASMGGADEILGLLGGDADAYRGRLADEREAHTYITTGSEIAGGILPILATGGLGAMRAGVSAARGVVPAAKGLLSRFLTSAGQGAARGATYGGLSAEPGQRAGGAALGAGLGAALGGAIPLAGAGAGEVASRLAARRATQQTGISPTVLPVAREAALADTSTAAGNIRAAGQQAMAADAGPASAALLDAGMQGSGRAAATGRAALTQRAEASSRQVVKALDDAMGTPQVRAQHLSGFRNEGVAEAYKVAYGETLHADTLKLLRSLSTPADLRRAAALAKREGVEITNNVARTGGRTGDVYNVRAVDYVTRAMRDTARKKTNETGGYSNEARALFGAAKELRESAFTNHNAYREAVQLATPPLRQGEALRAGERFLRGTREEFKDEIAGMSPDELMSARTGMRVAIDDKMARVRKAFADPNADVKEASKVLQELSSRDVRDRIQLVLGDKATPLFDSLDEASRTFTLMGRVAPNSGTFARQATSRALDEELQDPVARFIQGIAGIRHGNVPGGIGQAGRAAARDAQSDELVRLMTSPGSTATLDKITRSIDPNSTREAVRQWVQGLGLAAQAPAQVTLANQQR